MYQLQPEVRVAHIVEEQSIGPVTLFWRQRFDG